MATSPAYVPTLGRGGTRIGESWVQNGWLWRPHPEPAPLEGVAGPTSRDSGGRAGGGDRITITVHPNVRHDLGDLADLTRSVKAIGVRVPTVVVRGEDDQYLILYGQRRHAAAIAAGRPLPAIVTEDIDEAGRIVNQLAENQYRKELTPAS